jgi:hypothetical protein
MAFLFAVASVLAMHGKQLIYPTSGVEMGWAVVVQAFFAALSI